MVGGNHRRSMWRASLMQWNVDGGFPFNAGLLLLGIAGAVRLDTCHLVRRTGLFRLLAREIGDVLK